LNDSVWFLSFNVYKSKNFQRPRVHFNEDISTLKKVSIIITFEWKRNHKNDNLKD